MNLIEFQSPLFRMNESVVAMAGSRLGVFTAQLGAVSETFIRHHIEDLRPGRTVAVARRSLGDDVKRWTHSGPVLLLDRATNALGSRLARRMGVADHAV